MLLSDAVVEFLDEQSDSEDFDLNDQEAWLEQHVHTIIGEWADEHGWEFDEEQCAWRKSGS